MWMDCVREWVSRRRVKVLPVLCGAVELVVVVRVSRVGESGQCCSWGASVGIGGCDGRNWWKRSVDDGVGVVV